MTFLPEATAVAQNLTSRYPDQLSSILAYPHPFTAGGLIIIWQDEAEPWLNLVAAVQMSVPPQFSRHCLRKSELSQLSQPNLFAPPLQISERVHLPYYLHHHGHVLFGNDVRQAIQPVAPQLALAGHLEGCLDYLRRYGILTLLMQDKYAELQGMLEHEMRYLMATALLLHGEWEVVFDTLPDQFHPYFPAEYETWAMVNDGSTAVTKQSAYKSVWLFEQFLRQLRAYT